MNGPLPLTRLVGQLTARDWLTMVELATYGKFPSGEAARCWVRRNRADLIVARRGRRLLVDRVSFDRLIERRLVQPA